MEPTQTEQDPSADKPQESISLGTFFYQQFRRYSNNICEKHYDGEIERTYWDIHIEAARLAKIIAKAAKPTPDDYILIMCLYEPSMTAPVIATLYLGVKLCFIRPSLLFPYDRTNIIKELISNIKPKVIIVQEKFFQHWYTFIENYCITTGAVLFVITKFNKYSLFFPDRHKHKKLDITEVSVPNVDVFKPRPIAPANEAIIFFTKGSSNLDRKPKPVCASHQALLNNMKLFCDHEEFDMTTTLHLNDISYVPSFVMFLATLRAGGCRVITPYPLHPIHFMNILRDYTVTLVDTGHLFMDELEGEGPRLNIPTLKSVIVSGFRVPMHFMRFLKELFRHSDLYYAYTITEALGYASLQLYSKKAPLDYDHEVLSVGKKEGPVCFKIGSYEDDPPYPCGLILLKSPNMMMGYHASSGLTAQYEGDFFKTGDIGSEEDDKFYVYNCSSDVYKIGGENVFPGYVEAKLEVHPNIKQVCVLPMHKNEQILCACVVPKGIVSFTQHQFHIYSKNLFHDEPKNCIKGKVQNHLNVPRNADGHVGRKEISIVFFTKGVDC